MSARMRVDGRGLASRLRGGSGGDSGRSAPRLDTTVLTIAVLAGLVGVAGCEMMDGQTNHAPVRWSAAKNRAREDAPLAPEPKILPVTYFRTGQIHELRGAPERALEQYRKAIALNHKFLAAYNREGIVLDRLGRYEEANAAFLKAIELEPAAAYLRNNLAFSYMLQHGWLAAEAELRNALQLAPQFARARINLGVTLGRLERYEEAQAQFREVLPDAAVAYNMGLLYRANRDDAQALTAFQQALAARPTLGAAQAQIEAIHAAQQAATAQARAAATTTTSETPPPPELAANESADTLTAPAPQEEARSPSMDTEPGAAETEDDNASAVPPDPEQPPREVESKGLSPATSAEDPDAAAPDESMSAVPQDRATPEAAVAEPVADAAAESMDETPAAQTPPEQVTARRPLFKLDPLIEPVARRWAQGLGYYQDTLIRAGRDVRGVLEHLEKSVAAQQQRRAIAAADARAAVRRAVSLRVIGLARGEIVRQIRWERDAQREQAATLSEPLPTPVVPEPIAFAAASELDVPDETPANAPWAIAVEVTEVVEVPEEAAASMLPAFPMRPPISLVSEAIDRAIWQPGAADGDGQVARPMVEPAAVDTAVFDEAVRITVAEAFPMPAVPDPPPVPVAEPAKVRQPLFKLDPIIAPSTRTLIAGVSRLHDDLVSAGNATEATLEVLHEAVAARARQQAAEARAIARRALSLRIVTLARQEVVRQLRAEAEHNRQLGRRAWLALLSHTLQMRPQTLARRAVDIDAGNRAAAGTIASGPDEPVAAAQPAEPTKSAMLVQAGEALLNVTQAVPPAVEQHASAAVATPRRPEEQWRAEVAVRRNAARRRGYSLRLLALARDEVNRQMRTELVVAEAVKWMRAVDEAAGRGMLVHQLDASTAKPGPTQAGNVSSAAR